jgi:excisionase family DNA binding protein
MRLQDFPELLLLDEVAVILRTSKANVRRMALAGDFQAVRVGKGRAWRIVSTSLTAYLATRASDTTL